MNWHYDDSNEDSLRAPGYGTCFACPRHSDSAAIQPGDEVKKVVDPKSPAGLYCHARHSEDEITIALSMPRCGVTGCGTPLSRYNATGKCARHSR